MKQLLIILVLVGLSLGVARFLKSDEEDPRRSGGRDRFVPQPGATGTQRPETGLGPGTRLSPSGNATVTYPQGMLDRMDAQASLTWYDTVDEETLVPMEEVWDVDLSEVDFDADVLCHINGEPVTQEDLRRRLILHHGMPVVRARFFNMAGRRLAEKYGMDFGMSDEEFDEYFQTFARQRGQTPVDALNYMSMKAKVPPTAAKAMRKDFVEGLLAFFPPAELYEQLPPEVRDFLDDDQKAKAAMSVIGILQKSRGNFDGGGERTQAFSMAIETMAAVAQGAFNDEVFRRSWTYLDGEVPEGAFAGFAMGDLEDTSILAPWLIPGEPEWIETDPTYGLIESLFLREHLEEGLRNVLWEKGLRQDLKAKGSLLSPEETWSLYAEEYLAGRNAATPFDMLINAAFGYQTMEQYAESLGLMEGFKRSQPDGWDAEGELADFFDSHRFFIQRWTPQLDVAFFPPRDMDKVAEAEDVTEVEIDMDFAKAKAEEFLAKLDEGATNWDTVIEEHRTAQYERFHRALGKEQADALATQLGSASGLALPQTQVQQLLKQQQSDEFLNGTSALRNAAVRLKKNEVSPPWKTPIGYLVVRMRAAQLSGLEKEYEDLEFQTASEFYDTYFRLWVHETMSSAEVTVP